ncbi:MAG: cyclic nucleotide-binding domain-containing protein [Verrucomicrobiota bacterium]|nr:cyclic nucleotide-binding domain-containing protein [Verrucomicrobiota bacterium]
MSTQFLSGFGFFSALDEVELQAILELTRTKNFEAGAEVLREGDPNDTMFLVQSGSVEVLKIKDNKEILLGTIEANNFLGEMSLFYPASSSASVRAIEKTCLLTIKHEDLLAFVKDRPEAGNKLLMDVLKVVCQRLKEINDRYGECLFWIAEQK